MGWIISCVRVYPTFNYILYSCAVRRSVMLTGRTWRIKQLYTLTLTSSVCHRSVGRSVPSCTPRRHTRNHAMAATTSNQCPIGYGRRSINERRILRNDRVGSMAQPQLEDGIGRGTNRGRSPRTSKEGSEEGVRCAPPRKTVGISNFKSFNLVYSWNKNLEIYCSMKIRRIFFRGTR